MARTYNVLTRFNAKDGVSKVTKSMTTGVNRFGNAVKNSNSMFNKGLKKADRMVNRFAMVGLAGVVAFAGLATHEFISLEGSVVNAGAKFKDLDTKSLNYKDSLDQLTISARQVGAVTEFSATDAAGALDKFAMAGVNSTTAMSLLMGTTNLATAAGVDLTTSVDIVTDSLGAFGFTAKMTGDAITDAKIAEEGLNRISDVFAKTTTTSNTTLEMLFETAKKSGPIFTSTGQSLETFAAFSGVLANSTLKAEESGTMLRTMMLSLAKTTPEAQRQLNRLGVAIKDSDGNFRDILDIISDLEGGLEGMGNVQKTNIITTIFGRRAVAGMNIVLQEGSDKLRDYRSKLIDSSGAAEDMAEAIRKSLGNQLKVLQSSVIEFGLKLVEAFAGEGSKGLEGLIKGVQELDPKPFVEVAKAVVSVGKFIGSYWKILVTLATTIKAVSVSMGLLNLVTAVFGVTLAATPIGWIIGIVAALVAAITLLVLNWDTVILKINDVWWYMKYLLANEFNKFIGILGFILGPIGLLIAGIAILVHNWDTLTDSVMSFGNYLKNTLFGLLDTVLEKIQQMYEAGSSLPFIGDAMKANALMVQGLRNNLSPSDTPTSSVEDARANMKNAFNIDNMRTSNPSVNAGALDYKVGGAVDVNFNNMPNGATAKKKNNSDNLNLSFSPTFSY